MNFTKKIEAITNEIVKETQAVCDEKIKSSQEWAVEFENQKNKETDQDFEKKFEALKKELSEQTNQAMLAAQIEARNEKLSKEEKLIERLFSDAYLKLGLLRNENNYPSIFKNFFIECINKIDDNDIILVIDKRDKWIITSDFVNDVIKLFSHQYNRKINISISEKNIETFGGVQLKSKNRPVFVTNTFEERFNLMKDEIRADIYDELL